MARTIEKRYFKYIAVLLIFLHLVFRPDVSITYIVILFTTYIWWKEDQRISFPIDNKKTSWASAFLVGAITFAIFITFSSFIPQAFHEPQTVVQLLASSTPALKDNAILTILTWGFIIPAIESILFCGLFFEGLIEDIGRRINQNISYKISINIYQLFIVLIVSAIFMFLHLTAKGITNNSALAITFLFMGVSCYLTLIFRETKQAIAFHMITNTVAVLASLGILAHILKILGLPSIS